MKGFFIIPITAQIRSKNPIFTSGKLGYKSNPGKTTVLEGLWMGLEKDAKACRNFKFKDNYPKEFSGYSSIAISLMVFEVSIVSNLCV